MSRSMIAFFITYVITRLFYWLSGFDPHRILPKMPGYLLDLGIWLLVGYTVVWVLGVLGIGMTRDSKTGKLQN
jgi:hypothetical protein